MLSSISCIPYIQCDLYLLFVPLTSNLDFFGGGPFISQSEDDGLLCVSAAQLLAGLAKVSFSGGIDDEAEFSTLIGSKNYVNQKVAKNGAFSGLSST